LKEERVSEEKKKGGGLLEQLTAPLPLLFIYGVASKFPGKILTPSLPPAGEEPERGS
jgi:hypothetical protein